MSTATVDLVEPTVATTRPAHAPIPLTRVMGVELRKMFDTRSGYWLMAGVGILATLATGAVIVFAPDSELTYEAFASAVGFPMAVILPMIAVLSVTGEWSQRTGLTTFTLVPHRERVIGAKLIVAVAVGVVSMVLAGVIGALGNILGTAITGTETVWNVSATEFAYIILANVLGMLIGFMLGVVIRNSPGAIVAYFVYSFVLTTLTMLLASTQQWFADIQGWVDFNFAQGALFEGEMSGEAWAQLAVSGTFWLVIPLTIGLALVMRSEVK